MIKILTDTASLYTPSQGEEIGLSVVTLNVTIAGKTYRERVDLESNDLINIINQGHFPSSSQPAPADIIEVYETATEENPILHITVADGLSGAYQSACGIRELMDNKEYITVYNSGTLCGPQWVMVNKAIECANNGMSITQIIKVLDTYKFTSNSFLIPQDFDYLRRGGRLTSTAAKVGSLLKLVPLMTATEDGKRIEKAAICRSFIKAVEKCTEILKKKNIYENPIITISHAKNAEGAMVAKEIILKVFPNSKCKIVELTPAFITQGGPKCIAIQTVIE